MIIRSAIVALMILLAASPAKAPPTVRTTIDDVNFIQVKEDFKPYPYQDMDGSIRIGYGTKVRDGDTVISEPEATMRIYEYINKNILHRLRNVEFDSGKQQTAVISFAYRTGVIIVDRSGKVHCDKILLYDNVCDKITGECEVVKGLTARGQVEHSMCTNKGE